MSEQSVADELVAMAQSTLEGALKSVIKKATELGFMSALSYGA